MKERLSELKQNVNTIMKRLDTYSENYLKYKKEKDSFYYYLVDKKTGVRSYVRKENISNAQQLAQRDYENDYLKIARKEIVSIEKMLSNGYSVRMRECYSNLHEGRKILVDPFDMSDEDYIKQWVAIPYTGKEFKEDDVTEYYTEQGERVRSKSEMIIANVLNSLHIPYKYESPLKLGQITIYPDFTILDVKERREKYLEHFGMMGDPDYVSNMMSKISTYEQNNIYIGDRLICTFESSKRPLNTNALKCKLNTLFDVNNTN